MTWDHVIKNGTIVTPEISYPANIYVKDEKIAAITNEILDGDSNEITDASGLMILPGFIETHAHTRDGKDGPHYKEGFDYATAAGAAGGYTTIFEMPNCNPAITNVANLNSFIETVTPKAYIDYCVWGMCLGFENLAEIPALNQAGVVAFKIFEGYAIKKETSQLVYKYDPSMQDVLPPIDGSALFQIIREVAKTGKVLGLHAENFHLLKLLMDEFEKSADHSYDAFLKARPALSELTITQTVIHLAALFDMPLHICHVSAKECVDLIMQAKLAGLNLSAETCPHYLELTNKDFDRLGSKMKCFPLVREQADQDRLWKGVSDGTIDFICADHAPHTIEENNLPLLVAPAGISSIEVSASLMLTEMNRGRMTLNDLAALLSENQAKIFGLYPRKGAIQVGSDADLVLVDPNVEFQIDERKLHSRVKSSPYNQWHLQGKPVQTILRGKTIAKNGEIVTEPFGKFIAM